MFVASVDVRLGPDAHEPVKMVHVDVDKDPVEPRQDLLAHGVEVLREGDVRRDGEDGLVVDLALDPVHEEADVGVGGEVDGLLVPHAVLPEVLVLRPAAHLGAGGVRALLADRAVDEVDPVEEVDDVDGEPVVEVLARGELDDLQEEKLTFIVEGLR